MTIPIVKNKSYSLLGGILFLVTTSIASNNFFGIPILGEPKDQLNKIIYYLIKNDPSKAKVYFEQFKKSSPELTKNLKLQDFMIPCVDCNINLNQECAYGESRLNVIDKHALRYLQYQLDQGINDFFKDDINISSKKLFKKAYINSFAEFNSRKENVLSREIFQGTVIKVNTDSFIIQNYDEKKFHLVGVVPSSASVGDSYVGYYWRLSDLTYDYQDSSGSIEALESYTLNLWWDY